MHLFEPRCSVVNSSPHLINLRARHSKRNLTKNKKKIKIQLKGKWTNWARAEPMALRGLSLAIIVQQVTTRAA